MSHNHEDGPPNAQPPEPYPEFAGPDEITKTDLRSPLPAASQTLPPSFESALLAAVLRIEKKVDDLTGTVRALDRGMIAFNGELGALRGDMNTGFDGIRTMLMGNGERNGIAQDVGLLRQQMDSVIPMASDAAIALHRIERVTQGTYDAVTHPPEAAADDQEQGAQAGQ